MLRLLAFLLPLTLLLACVNPTTPATQPTPADPNSEVDQVDTCPGDTPPPCILPSGPLPQLLPTPVPAGPPPATPMRVETVADGLGLPLGMVWTPDGRKMFFSEVKAGKIRVIENGVLKPEAFATLPVSKGAETGMLGLAIDPDYARNRYVYAYRSDPAQDRNHVIRFEDRDGQASAPVEILKAVSVSTVGGAHNGGRLVFGPDGMLYVSVGNGQNRKIGQDPCKLGGKILRVTPSGERPPDNPWACSPAIAYGLRNPFGLAIHPVTGAVFISENGGEGHDELNIIRPGGNYGHSLFEGVVNQPNFIDPIWESGPVRIGPTGLAFYTGDRLPEFKNDLFFCAVHTGQLSRARLAAPSFDRVEALQVEVMRDQVDCRLDVANGPDGALYFSSMAKIARITR